MRTTDARENILKRFRKLKRQKRPKIENGAISYVKNPVAQRSRYSLACAILALILAVISVGISVYSNGEGGPGVGAWGFSSIMFSVAGFVYAILSFAEPDTNTILAKAGIAICGILVIFWISMIAVGVMV